MKKIVALFFLFFYLSASAETWDDISRLNQEEVQAIIRVKSESDVVDALSRATPSHPVVISGMRHSQGGHVVFPRAIVLDMSGYNKIVSA